MKAECTINSNIRYDFESQAREAVRIAILAAAPEKADELERLWDEYTPHFALVDDRPGVTIEVNGDGREDVAICFTDQARNGGSYNARSPLLVQRVGGRVIALGFEIDGMAEAETCSRAP